MKINDRIYWISGGPWGYLGNAYAIKHSNGYVLVDTGSPEALDVIVPVAELQALLKTWELLMAESLLQHWLSLVLVRTVQHWLPMHWQHRESISTAGRQSICLWVA